MKKIWHNVKKEMPIASCRVLVLTENGGIYNVSYSKMWNAFNVTDSCDYTEEEVKERGFDDVIAWAYKSDVLEEINNEI